MIVGILAFVLVFVEVSLFFFQIDFQKKGKQIFFVLIPALAFALDTIQSHDIFHSFDSIE